MLLLTLLVKNEIDIIRINLEHHIEQGVDFFIVTDNMSTDGTMEVLKEYVSRGIMEIIQEPSQNYDQSAWVTRMAKRGAQLGAEWIIHADADEFWIARESGKRVRDVVTLLGDSEHLFAVNRWNGCISRSAWMRCSIDPRDIELYDRKPVNSLGHQLPPKIIHRATEDISIDQGNHSAKMGGQIVRAEICKDMLILHTPYRGYRQYENKIRIGGRAYCINAEKPATIGSTWRTEYLAWMGGMLPASTRKRHRSRFGLLRGRLTKRFISPPNKIGLHGSFSSSERKGKEFAAYRGVVTLADSNYFFGVKLLYFSLGGKVPLTVFDLGLNEAEREWVAKHKDIEIAELPRTSLIDSVKGMCRDSSSSKSTKREWPLWICPELISNAPYRQTAWIDADAIFLRNVNQFFDLIDNGPVITPEGHAPDRTPNSNELLNALPLCSESRNVYAKNILLNAGVSGWDLIRDEALLEGYSYPIRCIFEGRSLNKDLISWHDQGCLVWALQNAGYDKNILQSDKWNYCVRFSLLQHEKIALESDDYKILQWLEKARSLERYANVVHWNGHVVPWLE